VIAHIAGMPVEETLAMFAAAGVGAVIGVRVTVARVVARLRR
jgi:hypothetical protein